MQEYLTAIGDALPYLLQGSLVTMALVVGAMGLGLFLGVILAVGSVYGSPYIRTVFNLYVWFFRGVPLLVLLFLFYFGLFTLAGINISAFSAAVIVLGLISAAYQSQIFRGGILPQALRLSIPGWSNEYSIILKDSAVAYALGVAEVMARAHFVASRTYQHLPLYFTAGVIFLILTYLGTKALRVLEERVRIPGYMR
jgi:polar amino acid transport system permease protein